MSIQPLEVPDRYSFPAKLLSGDKQIQSLEITISFLMYLNANVSTRKTRPCHTSFKKRWAFHAEEDEANVFLLENVVSAFEV